MSDRKKPLNESLPKAPDGEAESSAGTHPTNGVFEDGVLKEGLRSMRSTATVSGPCPDEATLAAYADGRLEESSRTRFEFHLADCGSCLDAIADLVEMQRMEEAGGETSLPRRTPPMSAPPKRRRAARYALPLAAAFLITLVAYQAWTSVSAPHPPSFDPQSPRLLRSSGSEAPVKVLAPERDAALPAVFDYRFEPHAGAQSYAVLVVSDEGEPIWRAQDIEPLGRIPREAGLQPGQKYFLRVEARGPRGERWHSSFIPFTVTP